MGLLCQENEEKGKKIVGFKDKGEKEL